MTTHEINWGKCIEVCSDGAKAMTGKVSGVVARIKNVAKNCNSTHCILHRYALVTKRISATFKSVLDEAMKIINFIKSKPLQSRIFKAMCEDMASLHTTLLLHAEVRWLPRGKMLVRIFELRKELMAYFIGHKFELSDRLNNMPWLCTHAYLADIFGKLNELCLALQGKQVNILQEKDKLIAFSR
ncbi:Zinc finger BED domain-containing protein 5 [Araneus ventricosus]|uniref:Zinc finger BED domain-containing protein 5 n=1 Tax=Araneus ventricosus TaxID=182803 RepID=A0A4Y2HE59_ARAVE|nr:Zinc finger BED domain-containing protein 5 [Araneus ventricosus]